MRNSILIICLALLVYACAPPSPPPPPAQAVAPAPPPKDTLLRAKPVLSLAQMDSLLHLQGKPISASLWKMINVDQLAEMPDTVGVLSGNLDEDAEKEMVIWYSAKDIGQAMCFDKRGQDWHFLGETELSFRLKGLCPRVGIDPNLRMLLIYDYGWGSSGYVSDGVNFIQFRDDSIIYVLNLTLKEWVGQPDHASSIRTVKGKYKVINKSKISVNYIYELASTQGGHDGQVFFRRRFTIPYFWNPEKKQFLPRFSKRFARLYGLHREHSEFEFDGYFDAELEKISETGPMWKRHALGSHQDE